MITERQWRRLIAAWLAAEAAGKTAIANRLIRAIADQAHEWPVPDAYGGQVK